MINCNESQVELLMDLLRAASDEVLQIKDNDGFTALQVGVLFGRVQNVSAFLISTSAFDISGLEGANLLSLSLSSNQLAVCEFLIQAGVNPTIPDKVR
jgi:ankyrin repeat protein